MAITNDTAAPSYTDAELLADRLRHAIVFAQAALRCVEEALERIERAAGEAR